MKKECPIIGVNMPRFLLSVLGGFAVVFVFEYLYHSIYLKDMYEATASLWRSPEEMAGFSDVVLSCQLAFTVVLAFLYAQKHEGKGPIEGIRFGIFTGLIVGIPFYGMYAYMPIPNDLAVAWLGGTVVELTLVGIVFSLLYKNAK